MPASCCTHPRESEDPMIVATVGLWQCRSRRSTPAKPAAARPARLVVTGRDTSEGRQLRRWLTQLIVTERLIAAEADARGLTAADAPAKPRCCRSDGPAGDRQHRRAALADPRARALFAHLTAAVEVSDDEVPTTTPATRCDSPRRDPPDGWRARPLRPPLAQVRAAITAHLRGAARRALPDVARRTPRRAGAAGPGYEHPGDPRQPDHTTALIACSPSPSMSAAPPSPPVSSTRPRAGAHRHPFHSEFPAPKMFGSPSRR
ncbi:malonyl CoA-acyl carrier transacylase, FabD2 domain protein [Mycobacterium xenopi 4042]|uniref:Malonyl CoA-acyl carrier transacylase, FabD2 domain protein n=1 Tax=Mycobacterium xenopi 4042 TaxID=1299334 RepID=X8ANX8_MYCXE|nr:malonyl CoA-acyl carrier transacylase, FabD2 domain protein [Mycobacterium xenopi 4042]